ncbi:MAG TPA: SRPBCC domain-containing protein [Anaerolineales bacterium]|nr:SRPBCC domain-containing protein [Anaerolineales bacterium]
MGNKLIARATIIIDAPVRRVWEALTRPDDIRQYMFGTQVISDWNEGSSIVWKGEWQGQTYEDNGEILRLVPIQLIQYSHYSPLSGVPDKPENYHLVTVELSCDGKNTHVRLVQDNNTSEEERQHSEKNWEMMLENLKKYLEVPGSM